MKQKNEYSPGSDQRHKEVFDTDSGLAQPKKPPYVKINQFDDAMTVYEKLNKDTNNIYKEK